MRILFIYPDLQITHAVNYQQGIGSLSSVLKRRGHQTSLCHLTAKPQTPALFEKIEAFKPELIGFSTVTSLFPYVRELSNFLKEKYPNTTIICGGIHPTLHPDCINEAEGLDAICRGEGEYALAELVEKMEAGKDYFNTLNFWFKSGTGIIRNPLRPLIDDLDELPFPDRKIFNHQGLIDIIHGFARFFSGRGCPFNCTYCSNHAVRKLYEGLGRYVRRRTVENTLEEIRQVTERYRVYKVAFDDDTFTLDKEWVQEFCSEYKKRFNLPFVCNIRVGACDRDTLQNLKEAGCERVNVGIESGNPYIRNEILKRNMTNEQIKQTLRDAREVGLRINTGNMVGLPFETPAIFEETIKLNKELKPDGCGIHIYYPYPSTELGELCRKKGWIRDDTPVAFVERADSILGLPSFKREEILACKKRFEIEMAKQASVLTRIIITIAGYSMAKRLSLGLQLAKFIMRKINIGE